MEIKNIESVLEQAFQFGTFGTNAKYQSFKYQDKYATANIDLSQDSTGTVTYTDEKGVSVSLQLVIKTINENCAYSFKHLAFLGEISIRRRIIPYLDKYASLSPHFARFRYGTVSSTVENDEAVIVLENLKNVKPSQQFWDQHQLFVAMKFLGKLHSTSYKAKVSDPNVFLPQLRRLHEINFARNASPDLSPQLKNLFPDHTTVEDFIKTILASKPEPKSVICVGILRAGKTCFEYDNGIPIHIKINELFGARYAPPAFDLMSVMYLCVDQAIRAKYWNEAMEVYYKTLIENVAEHVPEFLEIQQDFKAYALLAYVTASVVLARYVDGKKLKIILNEIEQDILSRSAEE